MNILDALLPYLQQAVIVLALWWGLKIIDARVKRMLDGMHVMGALVLGVIILGGFAMMAYYDGPVEVAKHTAFSIIIICASEFVVSLFRRSRKRKPLSEIQ